MQVHLKQLQGTQLKSAVVLYALYLQNPSREMVFYTSYVYIVFPIIEYASSNLLHLLCNQVRELEDMFGSLRSDVEAVFMQAPSVQLEALATQLEAMGPHLDELVLALIQVLYSRRPQEIFFCITPTSLSRLLLHQQKADSMDMRA